MARDDVVVKVIEVSRDALAAAGFALVDLEYVQSGGAWVLRFFVERTDDTPVTIADCQTVSRLLDPLLDTADIVPGAYVLEVSSPGIDRRIRWADDFRRFAGEEVQMQFLSPYEGRRKLRGVLRGCEDDEVLVDDAAGKQWHVPLHIIKRANLRRL